MVERWPLLRYRYSIVAEIVAVVMMAVLLMAEGLIAGGCSSMSSLVLVEVLAVARSERNDQLN